MMDDLCMQMQSACKAQIESLQAAVEQHLLLQTQLEAEREASQAAAKEKVSGTKKTRPGPWCGKKNA